MVVVSVVIPVYNTMQWLTDCVESIRGQTLQDIEIILVDDGSTDYSGVICDAYAESDDRIRVIHQENRGVSAARNAGMEIASGKYIMFCDSDDFVAPTWCACAVEMTQEYPDAMISLSFADIYIDQIKSNLYSVSESHSFFARGEFLKFLKTNSAWSVSSKIFGREDLLQFDLRFNTSALYGEDLFFSMAYLATKKYIVLRNISGLYYYRHWTMGSLSMKFLEMKYYNFCVKAEAVYVGLLEEDEYPEFYSWFFWTKGISCLTQILDSRNPETLEKQKTKCQKIVNSSNFRRWSTMAISKDEKDPMLKLLRSGDFYRAYEPFVKWMNEKKKMQKTELIEESNGCCYDSGSGL